MRKLGLLVVFALAAGGAWNAGAADSIAKTKYPIVLAEGQGGASFVGIAEALAAHGAKVCYTPSFVSSYNDSITRGEQLAAEIRDCLAKTRPKVTRVNLVAHSQGGLDARYVLATYPGLLASVTTVGGPHKDSGEYPDAIVGELFTNPACQLFPADPAMCPATRLAQNFTLLGITDIPGTNPMASDNPLNALLQVKTDGINAFNASFPTGLPPAGQPCGAGAPFKTDGTGASAFKILLFSWGGTQIETNAADPTDPILKQIATYLHDPVNDGLVNRCSSHFGTVLKDDFKMNHFDEIGVKDGLVGSQNPVTVYVAQATLLKALGL